jgi:hypothetical protein
VGDCLPENAQQTDGRLEAPPRLWVSGGREWRPACSRGSGLGLDTLVPRYPTGGFGMVCTFAGVGGLDTLVPRYSTGGMRALQRVRHRGLIAETPPRLFGQRPASSETRGRAGLRLGLDTLVPRYSTGGVEGGARYGWSSLLDRQGEGWVSIRSFLATRPAGLRLGLDTLVPRYSTGGGGTKGARCRRSSLLDRRGQGGVSRETSGGEDRGKGRRGRRRGWLGIEWKALFTGSRKGECFT